MERRLITAALPYVNNIPHLGNIIQDLSADAFARYCRLAGYETLYVCGTDEYGTATETKALEEGVSPRELCDRYHAVHADIYRWFDISFDRFGRTSVPVHTEITQHIFTRLHENGYIVERTLQQPYCERCARFLADRYVLGTCPHCRYPDARGDQCESCGKLLDPSELVEPRCSVCGARPVIRETRHLFIDLMKGLPKLRNWIEGAAERGFWSRNAVQMTYAWMRDGLKERCITRDLKWGIPVPLDGYRDKVFYVWFDAPIGYISITAEHTPEWKRWWMAPKDVKLFQFVGKDNIPFHTVIFPTSLLGTGEDWTTLHHMSSTEYLNYEGGKFSKSRGVGVFGTDARETGIPVDVWRFYIFYNRPERSDFDFTWKDFQEKTNAELIGNLANLVNRTLQFVQRFYGGRIPAGRPDAAFWAEVRAAEEKIGAHFERVELRDAFHAAFALSSLGNKRFQDGEPWKGVKERPEATADLIGNLVYLVRDLAVLVSPFLPGTADRIARMLGVDRLELGGPRDPFGHRCHRAAGAAVRPARRSRDRVAARAFLRQPEGPGRRGSPAARSPGPGGGDRGRRAAARRGGGEVPRNRRSARREDRRGRPAPEGGPAVRRDRRPGHGAPADRLGSRTVLPGGGAPRPLHRARRQPQAREAERRGEQRHAPRRPAGRAGGRPAGDGRSPVRRPRGAGRPGAARGRRPLGCRAGEDHRRGHVLHDADPGRGLGGARGGHRLSCAGAGRAHDEGGEGQGAVIDLSARAAPLSALDASPELLQSGYWAAFKAAHGWQAHPFVVSAGDAGFPLLVLTRRIARLFRIAYVPFGPIRDPAPSAAPSWRRSRAPCGRSCPAARSCCGSTCPGRRRASRRGPPGCGRPATTSSRHRRWSWT